MLVTLLGNANDFYYENGKKVEVIALYLERTFNDGLRYYKNSKGHKIGVKNDLLVECIAEVNCTSILKKYEILSIQKLSDSIYLISIDRDKNIFEFAQKLYVDKNISIAQPNFRKEKKRR